MAEWQSVASARQRRLTAMRCTARRHRRLPTVSGSDLIASCSAEQSSPVLVASVYFVPVCSIILHSGLRVTGSRGHWSPQSCRGFERELHPGQTPLRLYVDPFYCIICMSKMVFICCFVVAVALQFRSNSSIWYIFLCLSLVVLVILNGIVFIYLCIYLFIFGQGRKNLLTNIAPSLQGSLCEIS